MSVEGGSDGVRADGAQGAAAEEGEAVSEQANPSPEQANDAHAARLVPSPVNGLIPPVERRWVPGQSGNPAGRRPMGDAARALLEHDGANARAIVSKLIEKAKAGDVKAAELLKNMADDPDPKASRSGGIVKVLIRREYAPAPESP